MLTIYFTGSILHQPGVLIDTSRVAVYFLDLHSGHRTVPDGFLELAHLHHNITCGLSFPRL